VLFRSLAIGADLSEQRHGIEAAEAELDATDRSIDDAEAHVRELDVQITEMEHEHPGGIPGSLKPAYTELVQRHNDAVALHNDLVGRQRGLHDEYKAQVDRHNAPGGRRERVRGGERAVLAPAGVAPDPDLRRVRLTGHHAGHDDGGAVRP